MSEALPAPSRSRATIRQTWIERLERFKNAQLSVVAFCRSEGISAHAFYYWKRQLASPTTPADDPPRQGERIKLHANCCRRLDSDK